MNHSSAHLVSMCFFSHSLNNACNFLIFNCRLISFGHGWKLLNLLGTFVANFGLRTGDNGLISSVFYLFPNNRCSFFVLRFYS